MSPHRSEDCVAIHFTWKQEWDAVTTLLPVIEKELVPYSARPHWEKYLPCLPNNSPHTMKNLMTLKSWPNNTIPKGKFRNAF